MSIAVNNTASSSHKASIFYLILLFIVAGAGFFTTRYLGDKARQEILEFNESTILTHSSQLTDEFEHIEREVRVLAGSPLIAPALVSRRDEDIANANSVLDRYNSGLDSSVSYLMDSDGITIASSNRNAPDSFVGKSYQFRPYFIQARKGALGRYFALGVTSLRRGFYAGCPVKDSKGRIIGVVVIKKEIDEKEADLSRYPYFFLVDPNGVIFLSSRKDLASKSLWPISRETRLALLASGQFGERKFEPVLSREPLNGMEIKIDGRDYLASRQVINPEGWSTVIMTSTERILQYKLVGMIISMWLCTLVVVPMIINYRTSRSAEMLRASETRYRELFDNISSGVAIYEVKDGGKDFVLKDFNKAGERIDGARKEDIIGKSIHEVRPGFKELGLLDVFERVSGTGIPEHHPASFYHDQKMEAWYENFVYRLPTGEMVNVYDDVTDRKRAEEALRKSEGKYRRIVETASEGICLTDVDSLITYVNQKMADMVGHLPEEMIGKPLAYFMFPEDLADHQERWSHRTQGMSETYERRFRRSDGGECWTNVSVTVIKTEDGRFMGAFGMLTDITERKQAEIALRISEECFSRFFRASPVGTSILRLIDNTFADVNDVFLDLFGYTREEVIGSNPLDLGIWVNPEDRVKMVEILQRQGRVKDFETRFRWNSGEIGDVLFSAEVIEAAGQQYLLGLTHDITERKRAEEEKEKLRADLHQAQKMESIGRLAGGIAHDFNNILAAIMGFTEISLFKIPEDNPVRSNLEQVLKASMRASEVVKQILTFTRQGARERKRLGMASIVEETLKLLRSSLPSTIEIREEAALMPGEDVVMADPGQIHQVMMNLGSNAGHAMRVKGGTLTVKLSAVTDASELPAHSDLKEGRYVCIAVSDTGHGMDSSVLERIFDPYFTTKGPGEGTGLGLSVVQGIVKSHGGAITVRSEPGQGTTFFVFLPGLKDADTVAPKAFVAPPTGSERILFVDDEEALVDLGKEMLGALGYHVTAKKSSVEALETFRTQPDAFDLVITDMTMPSLNGRELAGELIALRSDTPIILSTGFSDTVNEKQAKEAGIREFVMKPYEISTLAGTIRKALEQG